MKASELKPKQFFHFSGDPHKQLCRNIGTAYQFLAEEEMSGNEEVIPLDVQGWDEPDHNSLPIAYNGKTAEEWYTLYSQEILREPSYAWLHRYYAAAEDFLSVVGSAQDVFATHFKNGKPVGDSRWRWDSVAKAAGSIEQASKEFIAAMEPPIAEVQPPTVTPSPIEQFAAEMQEITGPIEIDSEPEDIANFSQGTLDADKDLQPTESRISDAVTATGTAQPDGDGWIEHDGNAMPPTLNPSDEVQVKLDGEAKPPKIRAEYLHWEKGGGITHYRIVNPTHWTIIDGVEVRP